MKPLVVTPSPYPTESLLGYTLRISEMNGYETPTHVLDYAGITRREALSPFFPIDKMAAVLGKQPEHLLPVAYSTRSQTGAIQFRLLGHSLGQSFAKRTYRLVKPAFCPQCVNEKGFLEAHWDVECVTACPRHACKLLSRCPACGKKVIWHRKNLLKCECGEEWGSIRPEPVDEATIELQAILVARILNEPMDSSSSTGMPTEYLAQLPLPALLNVIRVVGQSAIKASKSTGNDPYEIVAHAAKVFSKWPVNYERLIDDVTALGGGNRLRYFLTAIGRTGITEEDGGFLRAPVRDRLVEFPPIRPQERSRIAPENTETVAYATKKPLRPVRHNSLGERRAAAFLEIPVRALLALRASGHYKVLNIPAPTSAYHISDLENFRQEILELAPSMPFQDFENQETLSLGHALQWVKYRANNAKGSLIGALINGQITAVGRSSDRIPDILLLKSDVTAFRDRTRLKVEGNTLTFDAAAAYLYCDSTALGALVEDGSLQASRGLTGIRLTESSVVQFGAKYISVARLAKGFGTSSVKLQRELLKQGIPLKKYERSHCRSAQAFVSVEYADKYHTVLEKIKADIRQRKLRGSSEMPISARARAVSRLKEYLIECKKFGADIPRRAGKLNKRAIAREFGIDRDIFYDNLEIRSLCELLDSGEDDRSIVNVLNEHASCSVQ